MPRCLGGFENSIHISKVDMIVEGDNHADGLRWAQAVAATDVDQAVAKLIVEEIPNGACLQLGYRRHAQRRWFADCRESDLKDLGVHTEMYVDAFRGHRQSRKDHGC